MTSLSLYILVSADVATSRRGAFILLATTVPMLWSRVLFHLFANFILGVDASLVSWILGTHRIGNAVEFADSSAQLVIFPACSSLANASLAVSVLGHRESIGVPQKIRIRSLLVSSGLRFSGCGERYANGHLRD